MRSRTSSPSASSGEVEVRGDELRVVDAFEHFLRANGWEVRREVEFVDLVARRGSETLYAEAKGRVGASTGLDMDTMYGQLLRRMTDPDARYAVVMPSDATTAARRVPLRIRGLLRVDLYEVDDANDVRLVEDSLA
jgi:hypothetical protein